MKKRKVFFSFHYEGDIGRIGQVRNSWLTKGGDSSAFVDSAAWEKIKKEGHEAIKNWIDANLKGCSVTIVLIGKETANRKWVKYELAKSSDNCKGLLGITIHNVKDFRDNQTSQKGENPLDKVYVLNEEKNGSVIASKLYKTYDWVDDNGYENIEKWIEEAARIAGR